MIPTSTLKNPQKCCSNVTIIGVSLILANPAWFTQNKCIRRGKQSKLEDDGGSLAACWNQRQMALKYIRIKLKSQNKQYIERNYTWLGNKEPNPENIHETWNVEPPLLHGLYGLNELHVYWRVFLHLWISIRVAIVIRIIALLAIIIISVSGTRTTWCSVREA